MSTLSDIRAKIRRANILDEDIVLTELQSAVPVSAELRARTTQRGTALVKSIRDVGNLGMMEVFLAEYGLSTDEGVALMCLAEALLRVPDAETIDALIEDKIADAEWHGHRGHSKSTLVNASTMMLELTGRVLKENEKNAISSALMSAIKRVGEPVIRVAVQRAMKEMGHQFVLGRTIEEAVERGKKRVGEGYTYSYDMLGEAALTENDAKKFYGSYKAAIAKLAPLCTSEDIRENPGISIKLSALHPRYEVGQSDRVLSELVQTTRKLAQQARDAGMGLNIDAEEADRLDLSLDVIEAVLRDPSLQDWDGFGVVVQAFGKRAPFVLDWLYALSKELDRKIMVRLVKGAYWDTEIKRSQVEGLAGFPVFTRKAATDVSYICCAAKLLRMTDRIYPQFATHNAHTVAAVLEMADDVRSFEFQRLHGMGEALHETVKADSGSRCRIYAPVGAHRDLLAYLVRRLLENGANSSFVNQIVDETVPAGLVAADPFQTLAGLGRGHAVTLPKEIYGCERPNSKGWDLHDHNDLDDIDNARVPFAQKQWSVGPILAGDATGGDAHPVRNPSNPTDLVGQITYSSAADVKLALKNARDWSAASAQERGDVLRRAADLYEDNFGELFAVLCREAGKTPLDVIGELREAVDFLRYYAARGQELGGASARGIVTCVSPWNFPLAIFTGQISAALAAGNGVLAKPAETTSITAAIAVQLLHRAGVPVASLQLLPGLGADVGTALTADARINGVCFTGSTATALRINRAMAAKVDPSAPLIAETGGLNAMIIDSTALPEQAIKDVVASAFQSAGQRCSALRMLYIQEDVIDTYREMLFGAMDELVVGDPWDFATDIGPLINDVAQRDIQGYVDQASVEGRLLKQLATPTRGTFVAPAVLSVDGIGDLKKEVFGPILHIATYKATELNAVVDAINATGYGLTFGMHSRINDRIDQVVGRLNVGNIYINRNQIGAIVGSQPFGGEGLSGTGPKAGGPSYVPRFTLPDRVTNARQDGIRASLSEVQRVLDRLSATPYRKLHAQLLPGPTGESNQLSGFGAGAVLCLGPTAQDARAQAAIARENGCEALVVVPDIDPSLGIAGFMERNDLAFVAGVHAVALWSDDADLRLARLALASRDGRIVPLVTGQDLAERCKMERHICVDTTAAGGNAALLASI